MIPPGWHVAKGVPIVTSDWSRPEPDLAVIRGSVEDDGERPLDERRTALVVEIAGVNLLSDRTDLSRVYATAGIPVYWIVNLAEGQVEIFSEPGRDGYEAHQVLGAGRTCPWSSPASRRPGLRCRTSWRDLASDDRRRRQFARAGDDLYDGVLEQGGCRSRPVREAARIAIGARDGLPLPCEPGDHNASWRTDERCFWIRMAHHRERALQCRPRADPAGPRGRGRADPAPLGGLSHCSSSRIRRASPGLLPRVGPAWRRVTAAGTAGGLRRPAGRVRLLPAPSRGEPSRDSPWRATAGSRRRG